MIKVYTLQRSDGSQLFVDKESANRSIHFTGDITNIKFFNNQEEAMFFAEPFHGWKLQLKTVDIIINNV